MTTRSTIAMKFEDGSYKQIYCHQNGEPEKNGKILAFHYSQADRVAALLTLGNISSLGGLIRCPWKNFTFVKHDPWKKVTIAYRRDLNYQSNTDALYFKNQAEFENNKQVEQYNYVFDGKRWTVNGQAI